MADTPGKGPILEAENLRQTFSGNTVLQGLSFQVFTGETYCLLGRNGTGKTTTLHLLLGLQRPVEGRALVLGHAACDAPDVARAEVAYVPESAALYPHLSALENLGYLLAAGGRTDISDADCRAALEQVGFPVEAASRQAGAYSKGMRQKVVLALALLRRCRGLLLDEPTTGLDPQSTDELAASIRRVAQEGVATLLVTHDLPFAAAVAHTAGILRGGAVSRTLALADHTPETLASAYMGAGAA